MTKREAASSAGKETSATRAAYLSLRDMILTGRLPAGQKLKIESLRSLLNTGASPVREALSLLTSDMLVERIDQRGFRAAPVSLTNFQEILALREVLEDIALRGAIANAKRDWDDRLLLAHSQMSQTPRDDSQAYETAHKVFHMMLLDGCGMPMLTHYCSQLYDLNIRYRYLAADNRGYRNRDVNAEHQEILDAVIRRDADGASNRLMRHYELTGNYLSDHFRNSKVLGS